MELVKKITPAMSKELRGFVPSVVQPLELSGRPDSSNPAQRQAKGKERSVLLGDKAVTEKAELVVVDKRLVDEAAKWISAKVATTLKLGAEEVGEYVLDTFFRSEPDLARSRNPHKNASFRALAERCGTPELPISKTWLNNAVGVALMIRQLPEAARSFRELPPSYQETLLPLGDPTKIEKVAKHAATRGLSYRALRQVVIEERAKTPKDNSRGRPRMPGIVKTLTRSWKVFTLEDGNRSFTKADMEELDEEQRKNALRSAEVFIEKLKDLVIKLKKA
jgi:hypothetical protein